jgi:hypothetical protein
MLRPGLSRRLPAVARSPGRDPVNVALAGVFALAGAFYVRLATVTSPLALHGSSTSPYNRLADAFLHLHLWVARAPAALLSLPEPYNPVEHYRFIAEFPDYALYGQHLYVTWGPAPVLVLLVPLHLLGLEPSESVTIVPFAIAGLGFALATLRVLLRQIGEVPLWMSLLAALAVALCTVVPYDVGVPSVYHEAVAGGFCFAMAGVWLAVRALAAGRASTTRLVLMSLCFGLAAGSRPTLAVTALVLAPVYASLRSTRPRRGLAVALVAPVGGCLVALAAYNQARFGSPLDYGTKYQLSGSYSLIAHWGALGYVPPGLWSYLLTPPRLTVLFPFLAFVTPQVSYPLALPAHYLSVSEGTAGLLPMTPVVVFLGALPWTWRRRPARLGPLAVPLLILSAAGAAILLFLSYEFFSTTERYEVDYTALLLLGGLAAWLALSVESTGLRRRAVRVGGAVLVAWGCLAGVALAYTEITETRDATWRGLVKLGAPLSTALAYLAGHPVLADVRTANGVYQYSPERYGNLGTNVTGLWLDAGGQAQLTIVSPDARESTLVARVSPGPALAPGAPLAARVRGPGRATHVQPLQPGEARIPLHLDRGVNRLVLTPLTAGASARRPAESEAQAVILVENVHLAGA